MPERTRHSFQVDVSTHIVIENEIQLINHSCQPNCGVMIRLDEPMMEIYALRDLAPGEELSTDYASFEYEIEFLTGKCECGAASCRRTITGYRDLPAERRAALEPYIAGYLRELDGSSPVAALTAANCDEASA